MTRTGSVSRWLASTLLTSALLWSASALAEIPRFLHPVNGIYRGGQPETEADYAALKKLGVKTVINLRGGRDAARERDATREYGFEVIGSPMQVFRAPSDAQVKELLQILTDESKMPIFIHCHEGKDRTGLVMGLYRVRFEHWSKEKAYQEMLDIGFDPRLIPLKNYFWNHADAQ